MKLALGSEKSALLEAAMDKLAVLYISAPFPLAASFFEKLHSVKPLGPSKTKAPPSPVDARFDEKALLETDNKLVEPIVPTPPTRAWFPRKKQWVMSHEESLARYNTPASELA